MKTTIMTSEYITGAEHDGITVGGMDYVSYDLAAEWKMHRDLLLKTLKALCDLGSDGHGEPHNNPACPWCVALEVITRAEENEPEESK